MIFWPYSNLFCVSLLNSRCTSFTGTISLCTAQRCASWIKKSQTKSGWIFRMIRSAVDCSWTEVCNADSKQVFFSRWLISMLTLCQAWTYFKLFMPKCVLFFIGMVQRACYFMGPLFYAYFPNQRYNKSGRGSMAYGAIIATWMGNTSSLFMQQMKGRPKLTLMFYIIEEAKEL